MDYLINAQKLILDNTPDDGYYAKAYKDAEYQYWDLLYHWIKNNRPNINSCLDIGCAYGTWLAIIRQMYPSCNLHGLDFVDYFINDKIIDILNSEFVKSNIEKETIPFDDKFDLIIFTEVIEHLNHYCIPTLEKIISHINNNGYLCLSTPNSSRWGKINYDKYTDVPVSSDVFVNEHVYQFSIEEITDIVEQLNLKTIMLTTNEFGHINGIFQKVDF